MKRIPARTPQRPVITPHWKTISAFSHSDAVNLPSSGILDRNPARGLTLLICAPRAPLERLASLVFDIPIRFILSLYLFRHPFRLTIGDAFSGAH